MEYQILYAPWSQISRQIDELAALGWRLVGAAQFTGFEEGYAVFTATMWK